MSMTVSSGNKTVGQALKIDSVKKGLVRFGNSRWPRFITSVLAILAITAGLLFVGGKAFADKDNEKDLTFYRVASAATTFYDTAHIGDDDTTEKRKQYSDNYGSIPIGNAGAFVGFIDEDFNKGWFGGTFSKLSSAQQSRDYSSFASGGSDPVLHYVLYGAALGGMGLDSTANETFDIGAIVRVLLGIFLFLFYLGALLVDLVFNVIISILRIINPFKFFADGASLLFDNFFGGKVGESILADGGSGGLLSGVQDMVSTWYRTLQDFSAVFAFVIFFLGVAFSLLFWKKTATIGSRFKRLLQRLGFIFLAVPLLGNFYTGTLDMLGWGGDRVPMANTVISSTLIDFENWASKRHLAMPDNQTLAIKLSSNSGAYVDVGSSSNPRTIARGINNSIASLNTGSIDTEASASLNVFNGSKIADNADLAEKIEASRQTDRSYQFESITDMMSIIGRYTNNSFYHAADFEAAFKSKVVGGSRRSSQDGFAESIKTSADWEKWGEGDVPAAMKKQINGGGTVGMDSYLGNSTEGALLVDYHSDGVNSDLAVFHGSGEGYGLSTLSMYNYLTTMFTPSSVVVTSANKASSMFVQQSHHSVNLIGSSMVGQLLYYLNALVMLVVLSVLGFAYAFAMLMNSIVRGFKFVMAMPMAMLMSLKGMAKMATYGLMMVIELVATAAIYSLASVLFVDLNGVVETPLQALMTKIQQSMGTIVIPGTSFQFDLSGTQAIWAWPLVMMVLVFITILDIVFLVKMLKLRKAVVKSLDEIAGSWMDRLFAPNDNRNDNSPGGGAMAAAGSGNKKERGGRMKQAAGRAAGAALGGAIAGGAAAAPLAAAAGLSAFDTSQLGDDPTKPLNPPDGGGDGDGGGGPNPPGGGGGYIEDHNEANGRLIGDEKTGQELAKQEGGLQREPAAIAGGASNAIGAGTSNELELESKSGDSINKSEVSKNQNIVNDNDKLKAIGAGKGSDAKGKGLDRPKDAAGKAGKELATKAGKELATKAGKELATKAAASTPHGAAALATVKAAKTAKGLVGSKGKPAVAGGGRTKAGALARKSGKPLSRRQQMAGSLQKALKSVDPALAQGTLRGMGQGAMLGAVRGGGIGGAIQGAALGGIHGASAVASQKAVTKLATGGRGLPAGAGGKSTSNKRVPGATSKPASGGTRGITTSKFMGNTQMSIGGSYTKIAGTKASAVNNTTNRSSVKNNKLSKNPNFNSDRQKQIAKSSKDASKAQFASRQATAAASKAANSAKAAANTTQAAGKARQIGGRATKAVTQRPTKQLTGSTRTPNNRNNGVGSGNNSKGIGK